MSRHAVLPLALVLLLQPFACASEQQDDLAEDDSSPAGKPNGGTLAAAAGSLPHAGSSLGGSTTRGGSSDGGRAGATTSGAGGNASRAGSTTGGTATHAGSSSAGSSNAGGTAGTGNTGGSGGTLNQPAQCDEATATVLGTMNSNITVASNVCLKMTVPADQTWIKKLTLQPDSGMYPLPFTWSNCGTNSSGAFTANYANAVLNPITAQCPVLVKLGGNGAPINIQWWGG